MDLARESKRQIETLLTCRAMGQVIPHSTAAWIGGLSDELHAKLVTHGLCQARQQALGVPTLKGWTSSYQSQRARELKPKSLKKIEDTGGKLLDRFGNVPIDTISVGNAHQWRDGLLSSGLSLATVATHCRNAKQIFEEAAKREIISRNPFKQLKSTAVAAERSEYVTPKMTQRILEACPSDAWRVFVGLARFAALRATSETHALRWEDVDFEKGTLHIRDGKTKARMVPMFPELRLLLQREQQQTGPVVTVPENNRSRQFKKILKRAGIEPWNDLFQNLRRSCESQWASMGFPQSDVSRWTGHSMAVSEKHYLMSLNGTIEQATITSMMMGAAKAQQHRRELG